MSSVEIAQTQRLVLLDLFEGPRQKAKDFVRPTLVAFGSLIANEKRVIILEFSLIFSVEAMMTSMENTLLSRWRPETSRVCDESTEEGTRLLCGLSILYEC